MKNALEMFVALCFLSAGKVCAQSPVTVSLSVNANKVIGHIDKKIYGQLLEHIYHSINGGLWGEMIDARSFEATASRGWYWEKDTLVSTGTRTSALLIGDSTWKDYEMIIDVRWSPYFVGVQAPWSGGQSDIRFVFRGKPDAAAYAFHFDGNAKTPFTLERNVADNGKFIWQVIQTANAAPAISLDYTKWHTVKIKCEGSNFSMYWDRQLVSGFRDTGSVIENGGAALVVTKTIGRFKNLSVKASDGTLLLDGFPAAVSTPSIAPGWTQFSNGKFELTQQNTKNRYYAQKISSANSSDAGVAQGNLNIQKNETYKGSIWARGDGKAKLSVKLMQSDTILAQQTLGVPSNNWKEFFFTLTPTSSTVSGKIAFTVLEGTICIDQASMMSKASIRNGGYRSDLYKAVADLKPTSLRYPGGSFASGYNWKWGIGKQVERIRIPKQSWDDYEQNAFGTDEFMALCKRLNSEAVLVIRIGYDQPESERLKLIKEAQEWVEYCNGDATTTWGKVRAKNGHLEPYNVKYWEIDNEMWELGVEKYDELLRLFVPALKKIDPSIKIIACGDFTVNGKNTDSLLFFHSGKYFDYISLHHYESLGNYATGPIKSAQKYADVARMIAACPNPNIKLYISEWNASELDWRTGLYAGGILNVFEKEPAITMAAAALFLRRTDATGWNNAFINFNNNSWFAAPNYVVTKFYYDHFAPNRLALSGDTKGLNVVATSSSDKQKIFIKAVNPTNEAATVQVTVAGIDSSLKPVFELIAPGLLQAKNAMTEPGNVHVVQSTAEVKGNVVEFVLPALSVGIVSISSRDAKEYNAKGQRKISL